MVGTASEASGRGRGRTRSAIELVAVDEHTLSESYMSSRITDEIYTKERKALLPLQAFAITGECKEIN